MTAIDRLEQIPIAGTPERERRSALVTLDLVIPVYNEREVLPSLIDSLQRTFSTEACAEHGLSEVRCLFVDDGSTDQSFDFLRHTSVPGVQISIIRFSRNFGHQAAVTAGIVRATGDLVVVMDADLQDPPSCTLEMVKKWREGFEVVYAVRRKRKETRLKVFLYWAFYRIYDMLSSIKVPVDSGDFCLMSRRVVDELNQLPEKVRFPRGLRTWVGFPQTAIEYDRPARLAGDSHYGWKDLYALATDGIASLSLRPLQLAQLLSILYFVSTFLGLVALTMGVFDEASVRTQLSVVFFLLLMSNSIILFCLYILGAYLGRAYLEVKGRPSYIVAEIVHVGERRER